MGDLGGIGWRDFERFLLSRSCIFKRMKMDHRIYSKPGLIRPLVVPQHDPLPVFVILNNLRVLGASREDLLDFFE